MFDSNIAGLGSGPDSGFAEQVVGVCATMVGYLANQSESNAFRAYLLAYDTMTLSTACQQIRYFETPDRPRIVI